MGTSGLLVMPPLLSLPYRCIRFIWRAATRLAQRLYCMAVVEPILRRDGGLGPSYIRLAAYKSLAIVDGCQFFKIALSRRSTIENEYWNFKVICEKQPGLRNIVPELKLLKHPLFIALGMEKLHPLAPDLATHHALEIFRHMRGTSHAVAMKMSECPTFQAGLAAIGDIFGQMAATQLSDMLSSWLSGGDYHVGFAHGDFHSRNILLDEAGRALLVDLDCIRLRGIQELDALYFVLEMEYTKSGRPWHVTIVDFFAHSLSEEMAEMTKRFGITFDHGLGVAYLVDRVGQEKTNYGIKYRHSQLAPAMKAILRTS